MINNKENQLDRLIKVSLVILDATKDDSTADALLELFPDHWEVQKCNLFLDSLMEYCSKDDKEMWEQAAIIRDVKKKINEIK